MFCALAPEAEQLLATMPPRPRRHLGTTDHLITAGILVLSFTAGLLAMSGQAWWAVAPALGAILTAHHWVNRRLSRPNEPRLKASTATTIFAAWLLLPIWRGITQGETLPLSEAFFFAGLAPIAWLVFCTALLVRR